jgi:hypothetical protein
MFDAHIKRNEVQKKVQRDLIEIQRIAIKVGLISLKYKIFTVKSKKNI